MKKNTTQNTPKPRLLSRVLAEDLSQVQGGFCCTFTRCPIDTCDFDLD